MARILHTPTGDFAFDGGAVVVEFAFSGGEGRWAVFESLHTPRDLADWLAAAPLGLPRSLAVSEDELRRMRTVRTAFYLLLHAAAHGLPPPRGAVATVNRAAAVPPLVPRLGTARGGGPAVRRWSRPVTVDAALSTLARELIDLLAGPRADRIRECASDDCGVVFVDTSRSGARRWCSMERCGNRHKVRAFRDRDRGRDRDRPLPGRPDPGDDGEPA